MTVNEIREKYLKFFEDRGHQRIPSASLVPENDPTTLFTGSGMQPLVPNLLGEPHPAGKRLTNSQKSFRAEDIEEVGDNRHTTFFEMLGNWSLGDYFKAEQLPWLFEFLTDELKLPIKNLYVTVFAGDEKNNIPKDTESVQLWKRLFESKGIDAKDVELGTVERGSTEGMQGGRIFYYGAKKNWWTRFGTLENMPVGEPGGPDSEIFYDFETEHDTNFGKHCHPNCDCGRFLEIGNSVFMEYKKTDSGFEPLAQKNVDFGGGLERIAAAVNNNSDVFQIDLLSSIIEEIRSLTNIHEIKSERIICDHVRAATFLLSDGVIPSNTGRGYILRRLIRRASVYARNVKLPVHFQGKIAEHVVGLYRGTFSLLQENKDFILREIVKEEHKFAMTLEAGIKALKRIYGLAIDGIDPENLAPGMKVENNIIRVDGRVVFDVYQTYGVPLEISQEIMTSWGLRFDNRTMEEAKENLKKHQELSRTSSAGAFKGGLVDHEPQTIKHHTAHHLLLAALRQVLGDHVFQRGSNVSSERLRIDFSHSEKMTPEQIRQAEDIVSTAIKADLEVRREEMPKSEAEKLGALAEFGAKYGETVSVYTIFNKDGSVFSREFCGGPHVSRTSELGNFKILKEEASSAGVRRIKARVE